MRKGYSALYGLVLEEMGREVVSGDVFLFVGRDRKRAKVLVWDGTGLCLFSKILERGRFGRLWGTNPARATMTLTELQLFIEGSHEVSHKQLSPPEFSHKLLA
jgi:transposase